MYCRACQQEKEDSEFISKRGNKRPRCNGCERRSYKTSNSKRSPERRREESAKWNEKNPDYFKTYRKEKNKERCEYNKKWREENRERYLEVRKAAHLREKIKNPDAYVLMNRIRASFSRVVKSKKSKTCLYYSGCSSIEEYIAFLSEKTDNKNWIRDNYQVDHIWQLNWFSKELQAEDLEKCLLLINNHKNLRPLNSSENGIRSIVDFSPIKIEDLGLYENYLVPKIKMAILFYEENKAKFSGNPIQKGSKEERVVFDYLESIGYEIDMYKAIKDFNKARSERSQIKT
jgi:hypothetical protein